MYAKADLRLCWLHIPHCLKSQVAAHILFHFSLIRYEELLIKFNVTCIYILYFNCSIMFQSGFFDNKHAVQAKTRRCAQWHISSGSTLLISIGLNLVMVNLDLSIF